MALNFSSVVSLRAAAALVGICTFASMTAAQQQAPTTSSNPANPVASPKAANKIPAKPRTPTGPRWSDLTSSQQKALEPLATSWPELSESHKRKWLALAHNFHSLPESEQQKLQARMVDWTTLSAQERNQARQNFAVANRLQAEDRKAQWEAYQALSAEEKRQLAAKAYQPRGAAPAIRPAAVQKLAIVPLAPGNPANPPKIVVSTTSAVDKAVPHTVERSEVPAVAPAIATEAAPAAAEPAVELVPN